MSGVDRADWQSVFILSQVGFSQDQERLFAADRPAQMPFGKINGRQTEPPVVRKLGFMW